MFPGVYIEEIPSGVHNIVGVATFITAFIGRAPTGPLNEPIAMYNYRGFEGTFGCLHNEYPMSFAVSDFFLNGGSQALIIRVDGSQDGTDASSSLNTSIVGNEDRQTGIYTLEKVDLFNILCIPPPLAKMKM